jgi:hypothetical protein
MKGYDIANLRRLLLTPMAPPRIAEAQKRADEFREWFWIKLKKQSYFA